MPFDPARTAATILRHIASVGYRTSTFHLPPSLLSRRPATTEMHAVGTDGHQHVVSVEGNGEEQDYQCACLLAQSVGIELEDG